jgi:hypothetical protein
VNNSEWNCWHDEFTSEEATISPDGQNASNPGKGWLNVFAEQGFPLSEEVSREDHFPGTILYYYEVVQTCPSKWSVLHILCFVLLHNLPVFGDLENVLNILFHIFNKLIISKIILKNFSNAAMAYGNIKKWNHAKSQASENSRLFFIPVLI